MEPTLSKMTIGGGGGVQTKCGCSLSPIGPTDLPPSLPQFYISERPSITVKECTALGLRPELLDTFELETRFLDLLWGIRQESKQPYPDSLTSLSIALLHYV